MTKEASAPVRPKSAAEERAERLAAELRANLRRRKEQARGRTSREAEPPPGEDDRGA